MRTVFPPSRASGGAALLLLLTFCGGNDIQAPATGSITVAATTSGAASPVPDYSLAVDGNSGLATLSANGTVTLTDLAEGVHVVRLDGMPSTCAAAGDNPRSVSVTAGETATTTFEIACVAPIGSLEITTTTTGDGLDPDGYLVNVDGGADGSLPINGATSIPGVSAGNHHVELSGIAGNCTLDPGSANPAPVVVSEGQTTRVGFGISCGLPGSIEVTTTTAGEPPDPDGYLVSVDGGTGWPAAANGVTSLSNLLPGSHSVELSGIAENCAVEQSNPASVEVQAGAATPVAFEVTCRVLPVLEGVILFASERRTTHGYVHLFKMKPDGTGVVDLTQPFDGSQGQISPAGTRIVFTSYRGGKGDIFVMDADGANVTQLTHSDGENLDPAWSPDGTKIAFVSTRTGGSEVWIMNAAGSGARQLTITGGFQPSWSPDGLRIAFSRIVKLCQFDVCSAHIFVVPATGGIATDISANGDHLYYEPAWSPDGSLIAYQENFSSIWIMQADGSGKVEVRRDARGPVWSPDGSKIAFRRSGGVFVMNADGSDATNISHSSANDTSTSWR